MFRAAYSAPFSTADVTTVAKTSSPQTSPSVPMMCEDGRTFLTDPAMNRRLFACHLTPDGAPAHLHSPGVLSGGLKSLAGLPPPVSAPAPPGMDAAAGFYNPLLRGFAVRPERLAHCLAPSGGPLTFDPALAAHPYGLIYAGLDMNGLGMRKAATRETTGPLKAWLHEHRKNPYPTKAEKIMLAIITKMTLTQVSTWFANARRRLKKESRLYTGRDNDDQDDDGRDKDEDDNTDGDDSSRHIREHCESDEDINVDVSDVSDSEDVPTSPTFMSTSTLPNTTTSKHSPQSSSSSSGLSPYSSSPFHPSFIPRPGPIPDFRLGVPTPLFNGKDCHSLSKELSFSTASKTSMTVNGVLDSALSESSGLKVSAPLSNGSHLSPLPSRSGLLSREGSSPAAALSNSKPKIWSISEIIHSESPSPGEGTKAANTPEKLLIPRDVSSAVSAQKQDILFHSQRLDLLSHVQKHDLPPAHKQDLSLQQKQDVSFVQNQDLSLAHRQELSLGLKQDLSYAQRQELSHRLASSFASLDSPEVRLASRQASAFLVPGSHPAWGAPTLGPLGLASSCHVMTLANGKAAGGIDGKLEERAGSPESDGSVGNGSPQTEALDLHTKKEDRDASVAST